MTLLTAELRKRIPPLYSQQSEADPMVYAKFFLPGTGWTWYVTEGSPEGEDFIFFGYVIGLEKEWGWPYWASPGTSLRQGYCGFSGLSSSARL